MFIYRKKVSVFVIIILNKIHCKINRNIESSSTFILIKLRLLEIVVVKNSANIGTVNIPSFTCK